MPTVLVGVCENEGSILGSPLFRETTSCTSSYTADHGDGKKQLLPKV